MRPFTLAALTAVGAIGFAALSLGSTRAASRSGATRSNSRRPTGRASGRSR